MTAVSRSAQFAKVHKVLKKHYKPAAPPVERPVLDHLLFACCLEDARYEAAEEAFAALVHTFFDWNEIRVTSISELSEVMAVLPDPRAAANRIKRVLHSIFETNYSFDLEDKRKKNLGPTVKWLEKVDGTTRFSVAYLVQAALDGHSIPIDTGTMAALRVLDLVTEQDMAEGVVPGLERAIAKSKGVEFGSLLHQLGADYHANPFSPQVREILLDICPEAKDRFPQRRAPRESQEEPSAAAETKAVSEKKPSAEGKSSPAKAERKKRGAPKAAEQASAPPTPAAEPSTKHAAAAEKTLPAGKKAAAEPASHHTPPAEHKAAKAEKAEHKVEKTEKPEHKTEKAEHKTEKAEHKTEKRPAASDSDEPPKRKPASEGLSKRKPR